MSRPEPIERFHQDWNRARRASDPNAALATVASVNAAGEPDARTLILREVSEELAIFFNQTSPKWSQFRNTRTLALHVYWPSILCQYRLRCTHRYIPSQLVHESWDIRPPTPKRLDWLYTTTLPQSAPLDGPDSLNELLSKLPVDEPFTAPATAIGFYLLPERIERLEINNEGRPHQRECYELRDDLWHRTFLVP